MSKIAIQASIILFFALLAPLFAFAVFEESDPAQPGFQLVPCAGVDDCNFEKLIELTQRVINFLIFIAVAIAGIVFAYAGFLYLSAGGDEGQVKRAHGIFLDVLFGIIIALAAWLIVNAIASSLLDENFFDSAFWFLGKVN